MYNSDGYQGQDMGYGGGQYGYNQQRQQVQIGGFVPVPSEAEARRYPMSPWTMMVFLNVNAPYCYTKIRRDRNEQPEFHIFRDVDFYPPQQQRIQQQAPQQQAQPFDAQAEMLAMEKRIGERLDAFAAALSKPAAKKGGTQNENA